MNTLEIYKELQNVNIKLEKKILLKSIYSLNLEQVKSAYSEIDRLSDKITSLFKITRFPNTAASMAHFMDIEIGFLSYQNAPNDPEAGKVVCILAKKDNRLWLGINSDESSEDSNLYATFCVAHAILDLLFSDIAEDKDYMNICMIGSDQNLNSGFVGKSLFDVLCFRLAINLLVPNKVLELAYDKFIEQYGKKTIPYLASLFGVNEAIILRQLRHSDNIL